MSVYILAVAGKGGTGKTTICGMLIDWLCSHGRGPVLAVDADANSNLNEVLTRCEEFLGQMSGVRAAYTARSMALGAWDQTVSRIRAGWHPERSGDIIVEVCPGWQVTAADGSATVHPGDAYEPYPVMIWGPEVVAAQINSPVMATAVAPTLARCLRIRAPNASREAPLQLR